MRCPLTKHRDEEERNKMTHTTSDCLVCLLIHEGPSFCRVRESFMFSSTLLLLQFFLWQEIGNEPYASFPVSHLFQATQSIHHPSSSSLMMTKNESIEWMNSRRSRVTCRWWPWDVFPSAPSCLSTDFNRKSGGGVVTKGIKNKTSPGDEEVKREEDTG